MILNHACAWLRLDVVCLHHASLSKCAVLVTKAVWLVAEEKRRGFHAMAWRTHAVASTQQECECEDVAQKVGTTILFRHIHSGDVKSASEKCWLLATFQPRCFIVCALYGTPRLSVYIWAQHTKEKAQSIITVSFIG
jgi:hypothetical protein